MITVGFSMVQNVECYCSVAQLCPILCDPMDCSTAGLQPGFPVLHYLPEFAQTHVHWVGNAISPSHLQLPSSPFVLNLSQHQGLFQWVGSLHQVAKVLELQLQHQSLMNIKGWFQGMTTLSSILAWRTPWGHKESDMTEPLSLSFRIDWFDLLAV